MLKWYSIVVVSIAIGRLAFTRFSPQLLKMRYFFFGLRSLRHTSNIINLFFYHEITLWRKLVPWHQWAYMRNEFGPFFITIDV